MEPERPLIEAAGLRRDYGSRVAVQAIDLAVARGQVLGLLGPNGAGKSTTLRMLSGCLAPSRGRVRVAGHDLQQAPVRAKRALGYLPEQPPLYRELTVDEYLDFCAGLHRLRGARGRAARERTKARCGLIADGHRLIGNLSKGYQQRVGIAQALLHDPPVVILDEPTVGLDPNQILDIRRLIKELGRDRAVILSTHILSEVEATCDSVMILNQGRVVHTGPVAAGGDGPGCHALVCRFARPPEPAELGAIPGIERVEVLDAGRYRLCHAAGGAPGGGVARAAVAGRWELLEMTPERPSLEQLFVALTCRDELA